MESFTDDNGRDNRVQLKFCFHNHSVVNEKAFATIMKLGQRLEWCKAPVGLPCSEPMASFCNLLWGYQVKGLSLKSDIFSNWSFLNANIKTTCTSNHRLPPLQILKETARTAEQQASKHKTSSSRCKKTETVREIYLSWWIGSSYSDWPLWRRTRPLCTTHLAELQSQGHPDTWRNGPNYSLWERLVSSCFRSTRLHHTRKENR